MHSQGFRYLSTLGQNVDGASYQCEQPTVSPQLKHTTGHVCSPKIGHYSRCLSTLHLTPPRQGTHILFSLPKTHSWEYLAKLAGSSTKVSPSSLKKQQSETIHILVSSGKLGQDSRYLITLELHLAESSPKVSLSSGPKSEITNTLLLCQGR